MTEQIDAPTMAASSRSRGAGGAHRNGWHRWRLPPWKERRRRAAIGAGVAMVLSGLALAGLLLWQFVGTNWVSHQHSAEVIRALDQRWDHGLNTANTPFGDASAMVEIPRFGKSYRVPLFEGTSADVLAAGFGHITGTAEVGQVGNFAIAAHRVTHGEPLRRMPDLQAGDEIRIVTRTKTYVYTLTSGGDDLVVPFTSTWVTTPLPHNPKPGGVEPVQTTGQRLLTLTTCAELFHTDNRMVAFGVLSRTLPHTGTNQRQDHAETEGATGDVQPAQR